MRLAVCLAILSLVLAAWRPSVAAAQEGTAIDVNVDSGGHYVIQTHSPEMRFEGDVGYAVTNITSSDGRDTVGSYHRVSFDYGSRSSAVTAYGQSAAVVFSTTYQTDSPNADPFPRLTSLPSLPYRLSYHDTPFSPYQMNTLEGAADSPWVFFDATGDTFIVSPASDFPLARMSLDSGGLSSGIDQGVATLPGGFTHQTLLVVNSGINRAFDAWGSIMTGLHNKQRPANDADLTLKTFGYWTDNGAVYYYNFEPPLGYAGTLLAVTRELQQRGIQPGYLQLDSWWYPKGPSGVWNDKSGGIFRYIAAPDLFPDGLAAFQQSVGLPLVTHARWIDPSSPYRSEFSYSGNVMTDPRYWANLMDYLHAGGVVTYEQDWLGAQAQPVYDLTAPLQFMGNMASSANQDGLTLQYCMPLPRHVLQTVEYSNITSMRVSDDRFDRNRWDTFLYTSRLASALGVWPWSDVFMSTERNNLLLSVLSGGVVGTGDALGAENVDNILHAMRSDAVLVKPDAALVPTDDSIVSEAVAGASSPMVAWTYSDHGSLRSLYVFAYARNGASQSVSFNPSQLGASGPTYVYDYFAASGHTIAASDTFTASVTDGTYYVVSPIGPSGIALVGDQREFVTLGRQRISALTDNGVVNATVEFAPGEQSITLLGYATGVPTVTVNGGSADPVAYDQNSGQFSFAVHPAMSPSSVAVQIAP